MACPSKAWASIIRFSQSVEEFPSHCAKVKFHISHCAKVKLHLCTCKNKIRIRKPALLRAKHQNQHHTHTHTHTHNTLLNEPKASPQPRNLLFSRQRIQREETTDLQFYTVLSSFHSQKRILHIVKCETLLSHIVKGIIHMVMEI